MTGIPPKCVHSHDRRRPRHCLNAVRVDAAYSLANAEAAALTVQI
jgi:hypothetical protein